MAASSEERRKIVLAWAFARLDPIGFVVASATVFALVLFAMTMLLVLKGAPIGIPVGPNLAQLARYFPGYSVSFGGAFVGAVYAGGLGAVTGWLVASLWNGAHRLLLGVIRFRANLASYSID